MTIKKEARAGLRARRGQVGTFFFAGCAAATLCSWHFTRVVVDRAEKTGEAVPTTSGILLWLLNGLAVGMLVAGTACKWPQLRWRPVWLVLSVLGVAFIVSALATALSWAGAAG